MSYKAKGEGITLVDSIKMDAPKTQDFLAVLEGLELADKKTLTVLPAANEAIYLSCRNLPKHRVMVASDLSTYDIMNWSNLVLVDNAHEVIEGMLKA